MAIKLGGKTGKVILTTNTIGTELPVYVGDYVVIPKVEETQILETQGYSMANDVTIKEIPYFEVSNVAGGMTVTIG